MRRKKHHTKKSIALRTFCDIFVSYEFVLYILSVQGYSGFSSVSISYLLLSISLYHHFRCFNSLPIFTPHMVFIAIYGIIIKLKIYINRQFDQVLLREVIHTADWRQPYFPSNIQVYIFKDHSNRRIIPSFAWNTLSYFGSSFHRKQALL